MLTLLAGSVRHSCSGLMGSAHSPWRLLLRPSGATSVAPGGLTNHSSRRLRRGLTRALGLHLLHQLRPARWLLLFLGFGRIAGGSRRPQRWLLRRAGHGARIAPDQEPIFQGGQSLTTSRSWHAGTTRMASPSLQSAHPRLSVRPNHVLKRTPVRTSGTSDCRGRRRLA